MEWWYEQIINWWLNGEGDGKLKRYDPYEEQEHFERKRRKDIFKYFLLLSESRSR